MAWTRKTKYRFSRRMNFSFMILLSFAHKFVPNSEDNCFHCPLVTLLFCLLQSFLFSFHRKRSKTELGNFFRLCVGVTFRKNFYQVFIAGWNPCCLLAWACNVSKEWRSKCTFPVKCRDSFSWVATRNNPTLWVELSLQIHSSFCSSLSNPS